MREQRSLRREGVSLNPADDVAEGGENILLDIEP